MIQSFHFVEQIRRDLLHLQGIQFLDDQRYLEDIAQKITEYKEKYERLDAVNREIKQPIGSTNLLYLPRSEESRSRGAILLELGVLTRCGDKKSAIWVKVPRNYAPGKPLKYRISILNDTDKKEIIQQYQSVYQNEKTVRDSLKTYPGALFTKVYPTKLALEKAVTISRYYPKLSLFIKRRDDFVENSFAIAKKLVFKLRLLHQSGFAHGNISPENVYISFDKSKRINCVLGNLKNVRPIRDRSLFYTTPSYLTFPGILAASKKQPFDDLLHQDFWALGCTLFYLASAGKPFHEALLEAFQSKVKDGDLEFAYWNLILKHHPKNHDLLKEKIALAITTHIDKRLHPIFFEIFDLGPAKTDPLLSILNQLQLLSEEDWKRCLKER